MPLTMVALMLRELKVGDQQYMRNSHPHGAVLGTSVFMFWDHFVWNWGYDYCGQECCLLLPLQCGVEILFLA